MVLFGALLSLERLLLRAHRRGLLLSVLLLLLLVLLLLHLGVLLLLVHLLFLGFTVLLLLGRGCLGHLLALTLSLALTTCTFSHLLVIGLMLCKNFLSHFLLLFMNIGVELVPVFSNRELLIIINWDEDLLGANWLFFRVMELGNIWML